MRTAARPTKLDTALVHGDRELQREELACRSWSHLHGHRCRHRHANRGKLTFSYPELTNVEAWRQPSYCWHPISRVLEVHDIDFDTRTMMLKPKWKNVQSKSWSIYGMVPTSKDWRGKVLILVDKMPFEIDERSATMTFTARKLLALTSPTSLSLGHVDTLRLMMTALFSRTGDDL